MLLQNSISDLEKLKKNEEEQQLLEDLTELSPIEPSQCKRNCTY